MIPTRKVNKRQLILDEAAKLFKQKGFGGTSMRDLASEVGIEAASMYNHIKSKDEILELICFRISGIYISQLAEIEATQAAYGEKIKALIRLHIRLMIEDGAAVSVANHDWKYLREPALTEFKQARKQYEKGFAALIEQGIAAGEFQPVNVSVALFTILSAVRWVELWYRPGRELSAEELEANIITMLLTGLEKK
ncbi:TetR family transcriptional regulator [Microvirga sp. STR05]|uniref:TetR/AcrR family transcriptional regulator n=1 Tax=Hymenobacter duratus TaxID=2771356 RepID=A0ABR8JAG3_9BACT|nr:TetR/AcrR family transcriptional regulator [Hymenobacter duratus]MBD2713541.1 TetR/AcrR family transcriptional regulator [Hymenobacter duratus]MBR7948443.1 TetR family transcriptional regulator [Microvirga sp. STR05]